MSDVVHLMESECARIQGLFAHFVDSDLTTGQGACLRGHLQACAECRAALDRFIGIDNALTGWGQRLNLQYPPLPGARKQLVERLASLPSPRRPVRWVIPAAAVAAAIAAALALTVVAPRKNPPAVNPELPPFIAIPYLAPLDVRENAAVVRIDIRVATLIAAGYRVAADPDTIVPADVLVGEDGRAQAVRVLSGIDWNGNGTGD